MLKQRLLTAVVLAPPIIAAIFLLPSDFFAMFAGLLLLFAGRELLKLSGVNHTPSQALILSIHAVFMYALWQLPALTTPTLIGAAALWIISLLWLTQPQRGAARTGAWRIFKVLLSSIITIPAWLALSVLHGEHPLWLVGLLLLIWAADIGAYAVGKTLGQHRLAPNISPGKTWEGLIGGILCATLLMTATVWYSALSHPPWPVLIGVIGIICLISIGGDLLVSLLKRHAGSKDTGHILPGHGGLMDRIDSLCAAAPFFALFVQWWRISV